MRKKVVVLSLTKNEIIIKYKKKKRSMHSISVYVSIGIIVGLVGICFSNSFLSGQMAYVYNPVNSLYSDNSNVIFTSGSVVGKLEFSLPILGAVVENNNGVLQFTIGKSIMVMAPEGGVVSECGSTLDGIKYIKIKHNESICSVIENVDILGVSQFEVVKKGQDIATAKVGEKVNLKIYENDVLIQNLVINQSKITWQN